MSPVKLKQLHQEQILSQLVIDEHTMENELSILGRLLLGDSDSEIIEQLKNNIFTQKNFVLAKHKVIFSEIQTFFVTNRNQTKIDTLQVAKNIALKFPEIYPLGFKDVLAELLGCISKSNFTSSLENSISQARETYQKGLLTDLKTFDFNKSDVLESVSYVSNILKEIQNQESNSKALSGESAFDHYLLDLNERSTQQSIELPFKPFQEAGILFGSSNLVSVAGSPKAGKTSWALQTALEFAISSKKVLFFTLELSIVELMEKSLAYLAGLNPVIIKNIQLEQNQEKYSQRWSDSCVLLFDNLKDNISFVGDKKHSVWEICKSIRDENKTKKLDFVYIDQLSFIHTNNMFGTEKHKEYDYIVRELKELCKELKICIVLLAQLNRGASGEGVDHADIQHIKDSSAIAETSDILIMAKRNEKHAKAGNQLIEVKFTIVSRHSKGGVVSLDWDTKLAKFI